MRKLLIYLIIFFSNYILFACGGGDDPIEIPEVVNEPVAAFLVFPEKNTECNEGEILNDTQSKVTFQWNASEYTDSYEVNLQNLNSQSNSTFESSTNSVDITLDRGAAYKWFVVSKSNESTETAESESWQCYNAAPGVVNYAPFPADAINPVNGGIVEAISRKVILSWEASDLDNDIEEYEIGYGTSNPPTSSSGAITESTLELNVTSGTIYYWFVKTTDREKNTSESEVFSFTIQ